VELHYLNKRHRQLTSLTLYFAHYEVLPGSEKIA
jgi:hypothetical protein